MLKIFDDILFVFLAIFYCPCSSQVGLIAFFLIAKIKAKQLGNTNSAFSGQFAFFAITITAIRYCYMATTVTNNAYVCRIYRTTSMIRWLTERWLYSTNSTRPSLECSRWASRQWFVT